jgi:hypothetical protein
MGVWTENLSLPAVLNECLMQSYTGIIRLFPNAHTLGPARFENLRAVGALLVSAAYDGRNVTEASLLSEKGAPVRLANPWPGKTVRVTRLRDRRAINVKIQGEIVGFSTAPAERYGIEPA